MGLLKGAPPPVCPSNLNCSHWARIYLSYCLCNARDEAALILGILSIIIWAFAEVPQIIKNCKQKCAEGLSIAFLVTWIAGDFFNLLGCLLEPATLPTQFYMALLYAVTSMILSGQTVYYGHIYHRLKSQKHQKEHALTKDELLGFENTHRDSEANDANPLKEEYLPSSPIPVATQEIQRWSSQGRDIYFTSARSLSNSPMPTVCSLSAHSCGYKRTCPLDRNQSPAREPLLDTLATATSPSQNTKNVLSVVPSAALFLGVCILHLFMNSTTKTSNGVVIQVSRKLLQDTSDGDESSGIGNLLGWAMALIYMGGRLPQICLNIRRGNVQGLSPLMFLFALIGNATYVGSILIKSLDWSKIKPNLPWLVDAGGCIVLDAFILIQFIYFHLQKYKVSDNHSAY